MSFPTLNQAMNRSKYYKKNHFAYISTSINIQFGQLLKNKRFSHDQQSTIRATTTSLALGMTVNAQE